jgi:LPS export ABC transporter permease LptG/LPS export ABC transporter permease LptF
VRRIDRYIFREVALPGLIALVALTFMLVARELGLLLELIVNRSASPEEVWGLASALVPGALTFTIPVALLVGVLSGFGRLSSDSEVIAFRATGISVVQILRPVLILGLIGLGANLLLSMRFAPANAARIPQLTQTIALNQLPLALEPRVFNEDLEHLVIYVRDISPDGRDWSGVVLANLENPDELQVTWARSGRVARVAEGRRYEITLFAGSTEIVTPDRYTRETFDMTTIPVPLPREEAEVPQQALPHELPTSEILRRMRQGEATLSEEMEFHRRLALPFACIALTLVGLPLGLSTRRGGRSIGLVLSALLMLAYYAVFIAGTGTAAGGGAFSPSVGTWGANLLFAALGIFLLFRSERAGGRLVFGLPLDVGRWVGRPRSTRADPGPLQTGPAVPAHGKWFRTLDLYVVRGFAFFFVLVAVAFISLVIVVTLFELLPDIVENEAGVGLIALYFFYYTPQILYLIVPLAVLVAVFITLGSLTRSNETLAVRAGAISLYRMVWPLVAVALALSGGVYLLGDYLLPYTNQKQDAYRNAIKGRAAQTYLDPARKWMAGSENQIYFYNHFDPDENAFRDLSVFEFAPDTWTLLQWTFASRATRPESVWILENGWTRPIGEAGEEAFGQMEFDRPMDGPDYFKREVRIASQMNYPELRSHIESLQRAGFEAGRLTVDLYRKLSFPLVTFIMALIAIPFALATGQRGQFFGIGIAIIIGISYWAAFELFEKLGGMSQLSPSIAAWFPNLIFGFGGLWLLLRVRT